jgi:hypothetical protein
MQCAGFRIRREEWSRAGVKIMVLRQDALRRTQQNFASTLTKPADP